MPAARLVLGVSLTASTSAWPALALTLALLAGCGGATAAPSGPTTQPGQASPPAASPASPPTAPLALTIETSFFASSSQLPYYLALARGYYRQAGLDVTIIPGQTSLVAVEQVAAGQADVGQADLTAVALAHAKGVPVEAFMAQTQRTTMGIDVDASLGPPSWKGLYGHKVIVSPGSPETFLLPATLRKLGLDPARVQELSVNARDKISDYMDGVGNAMGGDIAGANPQILPRRPSGQLWFSDELNVVGYGLFARSTYLRRHPAQMRALVAASLRAQAALNSDPSAATQAVEAMIHNIKNGAGLKAAPYVAAWKDYGSFGDPHGTQSAATWAETLRVLHAYAGLKGSLDPTGYYTNAYLPASAA